jgi:hypothetical protein
MTRLTDAQIDEVWYATPNLRGFVERIAALAVQEVEREHDARTFELECAKGDIATLTAQLAEVTKERDFYRLDAERHAQFADSYRAQLSSDKREALVPCRECAGSGLVPATPSGEWCDADCGCKPPEAREVPSEVVVRVETRRGIGWYSNGETIVCITPADAKRIVAMGMDLTPTSQLAAMTQGVK